MYPQCQHIRGINYSIKGSLFAVVCSHAFTEKRKLKSPGLQRKKDSTCQHNSIRCGCTRPQFKSLFPLCLEQLSGIISIGLRALTTTTLGYFRAKQLNDFCLFRYFSNTNSQKQRTSSGYTKTSKKHRKQKTSSTISLTTHLKNFYQQYYLHMIPIF